MRYAALILILIAGTASAEETFRCQAGPVWFDDEPIVLVLTVDDEGESGSIKVASVTYTALYYVKGFDRRWDFGLRDDGSFSYSVVMQPSGNASYYDFSGVEMGERATSSQQYICK